MFKLATAVRWTCMMVMVFSFAPTQAQNSSNPETAEAAMIYIACGRNGETKNTPECKEAMTFARNKNYGSQTDPCTTAEADYKKAKEELSGACGEAGVSESWAPEGKEGSNISCGASMARCACRFKSTSSSDRDRLGCNGEDTIYDSSSSSGMSSSRGPDLAAARKRFNYCPAIASSGLKDFQDKLDRSEDRIKDLESKLPKMQTDSDKGTQDSQKRMDELQDKLQENQDKFAEEAEKAQEGLAEEQKRLMDQIGQLQSQILQLQEQIGQMDLSRQEAALKRDEAKKQVRLQCHASAQGTAAKLQSEALELRRQGKLNLGGFNTLMKQVGITDRQQWQKVAERYYTWCLQSQATRDSLDSANVIYEAAIAQTRKVQNDTRNRILLLQQQMKQIKDPASGCNPMAQPGPDGSPNESQLCSAVRRSAQKQQRLAQAAMNKNASLMRQIEGEQAHSGQNQLRKDEELGKARIDLDAEKARRDKLQQYVDLANESGGDAEGDKGEFKKANGKFQQLNDAAANLVACNRDGCREGSACSKARNYLKEILGRDVSPGATPSSTPPPNPPPAQPPQPPPNPPIDNSRGRRATGP